MNKIHILLYLMFGFIKSPFQRVLLFTSSEYTSSSGGYWTAPPTEAATTTKHIKPHNKRYSKVNVPVRVSAPLPPVAVETTTATLDANKRKQLPAWIREGITFSLTTKQPSK